MSSSSGSGRGDTGLRFQVYTSTLHTTRGIYFQEYKGTVSVILCDSPFKDCHVQFTRVPLNYCSIKDHWMRYPFTIWKFIISTLKWLADLCCRGNEGNCRKDFQFCKTTISSKMLILKISWMVQCAGVNRTYHFLNEASRLKSHLALGKIRRIPSYKLVYFL